MLRAFKGLTQEDLAKKINKTRSMVSFIEQTGKTNHYTLMAILKALNISESEIESFDGKVFGPNELEAFYKTELELIKQKLETLIKENEALKELIVSQKKLIALHEKKRK